MYSEKKIKKKLPIEHVEKCLKCWLFHITTCKKKLENIKTFHIFCTLKNWYVYLHVITNEREEIL